jgi:hypothetical protein
MMIGIRTVAFALGLAAAASMTAEPARLPFDRVLEATTGRRLVLVGELHGTAEIPARFGELAAAMAETAPLTVALEIPRDEQGRLDAFLDSAGSEADRVNLLAGDFWTRSYQDGRSSAAMLGLLERLRQLRLKHAVSVCAFDVESGTELAAPARERAMAARLAEWLAGADPEVRLLVLTGNLHSRVVGSAPWDPEHRFMGSLLAEHDPLGIEMLPVSGSAWTCTGGEVDSCKRRVLPASQRQPGLSIGSEVNERGHHGLWLLPVATASPPAVPPRGESP